MEQPIDHHHGEPAAHQLNAQHRRAEEEHKLQRRLQQPEPLHRFLSRDHQQRKHEIGNQAEAKSRQYMDAKPAFPPQGQRMEGIAHPAIEQVTKENLGAEQCVDQVSHNHSVAEICYAVRHTVIVTV